jgi:hypothetical protein
MYSNMNGAGQRPTPAYVWSQMQSQLTDGTHDAEDVKDAELDEAPEFTTQDLSWPYFVTMLLAHGWFLRPKAFPLGRDDDKPSTKFQNMKRRIAIFVGAWIAASALFPASWVALALAAWGVAALPGLIEIHRQFQHVPHGEPDPI